MPRIGRDGQRVVVSAVLVALLMVLSACAVVTFDGAGSGDQTTTGDGDGNDVPASAGGSAEADEDGAALEEAAEPPIDGDDEVPSGAAEGSGADICDRLTTLPHPDRVVFLSGLDASAESDVTTVCGDVVAAVEEVAAVAAMSDQLTDVTLFRSGLGTEECGPRSFAISFRSPFDVPVRLIATVDVVVNGEFLAAQPWMVTDPIGPGELVELELDYGLDIGNADVECLYQLQGFLELDDEVTDTWEPSSDSASDPRVEPGSATTGDDMAAVLAGLLTAEVEIAARGEWNRSGLFEDVRSANYQDLVEQTETLSFVDNEFIRLCVTVDITDQLRAVVWERRLVGPEHGAQEGTVQAALGVFHRSSIDQRWRWVHAVRPLNAELACGVQI